jgi:serine/threonine protein kinase
LTSINDEQQKIKDRILKFTFRNINKNVEIVTECSDFMNINSGQVYRIEDKDFFIRGETYESRFGIADQPKYWAKHAIDLNSGYTKILKFAFYEEFIANIGPLRIRCYRDPEKESNVLNFVQGDLRFMQGVTIKDRGGNLVKIIDFIKGKSIYAYIFDCQLSHEEYYYKQVPWLLKNIAKCFEAIKLLHDNNLCHGDIRNDHIYIESKTNLFRWIDFDLTQSYSDFDIWSCGNVLSYIIAKGIRSFYELKTSNKFVQSIKDSVKPDDASAFYNYRIMNLKKLYPYISKEVNDILLHFTVNTDTFYENMDSIIEDLYTAVSKL